MKNENGDFGDVMESNTNIHNVSSLPLNPRSEYLYWCLTFFYDGDEEYNKILEKLKFISNRGVVGKEICPTTNKPHLQVFIKTKKKQRVSAMWKLFSKDRCRPSYAGEIDNVAYCMKENNYITWDVNSNKINETTQQIFIQNIETFYNWESEILNILGEEPDKRSINWFWGENGCEGKTTFQKFIFTHYKNTVVLSGKGSDMKNGIIEYVKKNKNIPEIVLINIPRSSNSYVSYCGLEEVKDMFFYSPKYEGGMICGKPPHVICFANEEPKYEKMSQDRWKVKKIN